MSRLMNIIARIRERLEAQGVRQTARAGVRVVRRAVRARLDGAASRSVQAPGGVTSILDLGPDHRLPVENWSVYRAKRGLGEATASAGEIAAHGGVWIDIDRPGSIAAAAADRGKILLFAAEADRLDPRFLEACARMIEDGVEVLSADGWMTDAEGREALPVFAPGANPGAIETVDYLFSRFAITAEAAARVLGRMAANRKKQAGPHALLRAWVADVGFRKVERLWRHDARPLIRYAVTEGDIVERRRQAAQPPAEIAGARPSISVVICTKDKGRLVAQLIDMLERSRLRPHEIVIVSNNTSDVHAKAVLEGLSAAGRALVLTHDAPFNFSRLSNLGAERCTGELILLLNDDIIGLSETWLETMAAWFADPLVAVVAPLLLYPDETVQHAGMYLGYAGAAGHALRHAALGRSDYLFMACAPRDISCVTGAAMLIRTDVYRSLTGLDEQLATHLQDVDFCLRVQRSGWRLIYEPRATLLHLESISVRDTLESDDFIGQRGLELTFFQRRWSGLVTSDRYYSPNFDLKVETMRRLTDPAS
jgi:GT2 family glycosyltransferase